MNFDYDSFVMDGLNTYNDPVGTVQGTMFKKSIECRAYKGSNGDLNVAGFMGKYRTGTKLWLAHVFVDKQNRMCCYFGFDSRSGKHQTSNVFFEPEQYFKQVNPFLFKPVPVEKVEGVDCNRCGNSFDDTDECHHCELEFAKKYDY